MRIKTILLLGMLYVTGLFATSDSIEKYLNYFEKYPQALGPDASYQKGEIEIIRDKKLMLEIQQKSKRKVGVVFEDAYWIWINDAVRFPSGSFGVYGRIIQRPSLGGIVGSAAVPLLPNGKIVLIRNFRHATRSWEYELPRGGRSENESLEDSVLRELKEETGICTSKIDLLGHMNPDSGITSAVVPIYLAHVAKVDDANPDVSEAIASVDAFSIDELKEGFKRGYIMKEISGCSSKVNLRDPFLSFALLQLDLREKYL